MNVRTVLFIVAFTTAFLIAGCDEIAPPPAPHNSLPAVTSSVDSAKTHVNSAEGFVQAAKPQANPTGQLLLDQASTQHKAANADLDTSKVQIAKAQSERDQALGQRDTAYKDRDDAKKETLKIKSEWGYRLQGIVSKIAILLTLLVVVHLAAGALSLVPTFAAFAVPLRLVGLVCNPLAWFQTIVNKVHLNRAATPCP